MKSISHDSILLAPSLLAGKQDALNESLKIAKSANVQWIHLDIMDGHFVPNISFGASTVQALRKNSELFFDVHLMLSNPNQHIDSFIDSGADLITIHVEPEYPIAETIKRIKNAKCKAGIALNPSTDISKLTPYLDLCDLVLIMSVEPGFGGQSFMVDSLKKIHQISEIKAKEGYSFRIEVDGGITLENAPACIKYGADTLVCGTSFFTSSDTVQFTKDIESIKKE